MLKSLLYHIDLFGVAIGLNFLGRERAKSSLGGFCTLLYYGFAIWALYTASKDMFSKTNPKTISSQSHNEDPDEQTISAESFPLAFLVWKQGETVFYNQSIYKLKVSQYILERITHENGTLEERQTSIDILTEPCTSDHFGDKASLYAGIIELGAICISRKQPMLDKISIKGIVSSSQLYKGIVAEIWKCNMSDPQISCASEAEINGNLSQVAINIYYANMVINPQNYSYPDSRFLDNYYKLLNPFEYQETIIGLEPIEVKSDVGWLSESIETKNYIKLNKVIESSQPLTSPNLPIKTFYIELVKLKSEYLRTYKKIQEVLAEAGGITSYAIIVIGIIIAPYLNFKFQESLMNEIFLRDQEPKQNVKSHNRKDKRKVRPIIKQDNKQKANPPIPIGKKRGENSDIQLTNSKDSYVGNTSSHVLEKENSILECKPTRNQEIEYPSPSNSPMMNVSFSRESPIFGAESKIGETIHMMSLPSLSENKEKDVFQKSKMKRPQRVSKDEIPNIATFGSDNRNYLGENQKQFEDPIREENGNILNPLNRNENQIDFSRRNLLVSQERMNNENESSVLEKNKILEKGDKKDDDDSKIETSNKGGLVPREENNGIPYQKIGISFWEYWCSIIYKSQSIRHKFKIVEEGIKYIETRLDIRYIIKQLGEMERLRSLILNSDQLILFENLPRLYINQFDPSKDQKNGSDNKFLRTKSMENINSREHILSAFERIKQKESQNEIDKKLLLLFDENILNID